MSSDWCESIVGEIAAPVRNALVGGPFGSNLVSSDYVDAGIPVIRGQNMRGRWISGDFVFVTAGKAKSLEANLAHPRDIIFTQRGTLGQVSLVPEKPFDCYLVSQSQMKLTVNPELADPLFLYYLFLTAEQQEYIHQNSIQTGVPHTNLGTLRATPVSLPPLSEQKAIAYFLGTLDDKMELNRQMNETLEATARLFFKDWFVDFGPTRAKAGGRPAYLALEIWSLFPDALDDDDKPAGWKVSTIGEDFCLLMGQSPPGNAYNDNENGLPFFQGRTDFGIRYPKRRIFCNAPTRLAETDDTLVSVRAPVGDLNMAWERCCIGRGVAAIRHHSGSRSYTYQAILSIQGDLLAFEHTGTVFGSINKAQFENLRILVPELVMVKAFEDVVGPMDDQIRANESEIKTLTELRDFLLPKLLSGEIRLQEAEKMAGQAL